MINFYIDNESYFYGDLEMFVDLDNIAIFGNRDYTEFVPEWMEKAQEILSDMDYYGYAGESLKDNYPELSRNQRKALVKVYEECRYIEDTETILAVLDILYPDRSFKSGTIRGSVQREWNEIIYDECADIKYLDDYYFGYVSAIEMKDGEESTLDFISHSELWENRNDLQAFLLDLFGYSKETECRIYESDGYTQMKKWKELEQPEKAAEKAMNPFVEMIEATVDHLAKQPEMVTA